MRGHFILYKQFPKKDRKGALGFLCITENNNARFCEGLSGEYNRIIAEMESVNITFASSKGIMLVGFQPDGIDKRGKRKYFYQEWWLAFTEGLIDES